MYFMIFIYFYCQYTWTSSVLELDLWESPEVSFFSSTGRRRYRYDINASPLILPWSRLIPLASLLNYCGVPFVDCSAVATHLGCRLAWTFQPHLRRCGATLISAGAKSGNTSINRTAFSLSDSTKAAFGKVIALIVLILGFLESYVSQEYHIF